MAKTSVLVIGSTLFVAAFLAACGDNLGQPEVVVPESDAAVDVTPAVDATPEATPSVDAPSVIEKHAAVTFTAPDPRGEGTIKFAGRVVYPAFANKADIAFTDPFPGCVAAYASENEITCDFGPAYSGTRIYFLTGVGDNSVTGGISEHAFSQIDAKGNVTTVGTYAASVGSAVVGSFKDGKYDGALKASDEDPKTANQLFVVP